MLGGIRDRCLRSKAFETDYCSVAPKLTRSLGEFKQLDLN